MAIWNDDLSEIEEGWLSTLLLDTTSNKRALQEQMRSARIRRLVLVGLYSITFEPNPSKERLLVPRGVPYSMLVYRNGDYPIEALLHFADGLVAELEIYSTNSEAFDLVTDLRNRVVIDDIAHVKWVYQDNQDACPIDDIANEGIAVAEKKWISALLSQVIFYVRDYALSLINEARISRTVRQGHYRMLFETDSIHEEPPWHSGDRWKMVVHGKDGSSFDASFSFIDLTGIVFEIANDNLSTFDINMDLSNRVVLDNRQDLVVESIEFSDGGNRVKVAYEEKTDALYAPGL